MPRSYKSTEVFLKGDPRYNNKLASKIINKLMQQGKKSIAQSMFYDAIDTVLKKVENADPVDVFTKAIENVKPRVEVRSKRVGGATYQVPKGSEQAPPAEPGDPLADRRGAQQARQADEQAPRRGAVRRLQQPGRRG